MIKIAEEMVLLCFEILSFDRVAVPKIFLSHMTIVDAA